MIKKQGSSIDLAGRKNYNGEDKRLRQFTKTAEAAAAVRSIKTIKSVSQEKEGQQEEFDNVDTGIGLCRKQKGNASESYRDSGETGDQYLGIYDQ